MLMKLPSQWGWLIINKCSKKHNKFMKLEWASSVALEWSKCPTNNNIELHFMNWRCAKKDCHRYMAHVLITTVLFHFHLFNEQARTSTTCFISIKCMFQTWIWIELFIVNFQFNSAFIVSFFFSFLCSLLMDTEGIKYFLSTSMSNRRVTTTTTTTQTDVDLWKLNARIHCAINKLLILVSQCVHMSTTSICCL